MVILSFRGMGLLLSLLLRSMDYFGEVEGVAGRGKKAVGGRGGGSSLHSLTTVQTCLCFSKFFSSCSFPTQRMYLCSSGNETACQCRRCKKPVFDPWVGKIPWRRKWQATPLFLPGKSHGQRRLVVHSVAESWIPLKWLNPHTYKCFEY